MNRCLSFALCREKFDKVSYVLWCKSVSKGRHPTTSSNNLVFNLRLLLPLANLAEIWTQLTTAAVYAVTVFTSPFVEEQGSRCLVPLLPRYCSRHKMRARDDHGRQEETSATCREQTGS